MPYQIRSWPDSVYPGEAEAECPDALAEIDALIQRFMIEGPSPETDRVKPLGKSKAGLWQVNLRVEKRQIRILYAPYGADIVLFRIHKKSSPQEQQRAYKVAMTRKKKYEAAG